jgi:glycerol-3-phosphate acyltransferase PlsY
MFNTFYIIFSYLLGSTPFGYLITRFSTGKNILEIGWRKTSGSNVFRNVGKWQGALTGILDLLKGYLAVFGAQKFGLPIEVQVVSGLAAVVGHNWSIFLKFAGGRGIGTMIGAFLALSPKILGLSLIPLLLFAIIWNSSIGTLLFFPTAIFLSVFPSSFSDCGVAGIFSFFVLIPVLIKRLSPIKEIFPLKEKKILIRNRLLFDNDQPLFDFKILKIIRRLTRK